MLPRLSLALLLLCLPAAAQRDKKSTPTTATDNKGAGGAPAVYAQEVKVMRGQSVVITLKGTTSSGREITFSVRDRPKLGTFKEEKPVPAGDKLSATITYTADPKGKGNKDSFTFVGQVAGSSVGDPATVTITITDPSAKLDFVETVDAKRVLLGKPVERSFLLRNGGNARWQGKVNPPKGWRWIVPADGAFDLGPGAEVNARISCLGLAVGPLEEQVEVMPGKKITFAATVIAPFTIIDRSVDLVWQKESRSRTGTFEVNNLDPAKPLAVKLKGPEWLKSDPEVTLAADQKVPVKIYSDVDIGKKLTGKLVVSVGDYTDEVTVNAPPSPAVFSIRGGLDEKMGFHFGKLSAVTVRFERRKVVVMNDGGTAGTAIIQAPKFFALDPAPPAEGIKLEPGASTTFDLVPPTTIAGSPRGQLVITGGEDTVTAECSANIDPADIPLPEGRAAGLYLEKTRENLPRPRTGKEQVEEAKAASGGVYFVNGKEDPKLPKVDVVDIVKDTGEEVTFGWDVPAGGPWKFQLLRATVQRYNGGKYAKVWEPCGNEVEYTVDGSRATARVKELHPWVPFAFRIKTIAPNGNESFPGNPISYRPSPPDPTHWQEYREWYFIGSGLLIALAVYLWRKWKEPISASA